MITLEQQKKLKSLRRKKKARHILLWAESILRAVGIISILSLSRFLCDRRNKREKDTFPY